MRKLSVLFVLAALAAASAHAAPTTNILRGGICINEVLPDPNSATLNSDTNQSGVATDSDEFIELYNLSGATIDIGGLQIWDPGSGGNWFTIPGGTMLGAGNYCAIVANYNDTTSGTPGPGPTVSGGNLTFNAAFGGAVPAFAPITNGGDNVAVYDPIADDHIQCLFNGDAPDNFNAVAGFSPTSSLVGTIEDFGGDIDGVSIVRNPAGDTTIVTHNSFFVENSSPGAGGTGVPDDPNVSVAAALNFGFVPADAIVVKTITVTNTGTANNLDITSFNFASGNSGYFTVLTALPINGILPAASATIDIEFNANDVGGLGGLSAVHALVTNDPSQPSINVTFSGTIVAVTDVTNIAGFRALPDDEAGRITGPVTLSLLPDNFGGFNQGGTSWRSYPVQDATGGMLVAEDDNAEQLSLTAGPGTTMTNGIFLKDTFGGIVEAFMFDAGTEGSGAPISPAVVTVPAFMVLDAFEMELVQLNNVQRTDGPPTGNWATGTNYTFTDGSNTFVARLESARTTLDSEPLPALATNTTLVGIGDEFSGVVQLSPVSSTDLDLGTAAEEWNLFE